MGEAKTHQISFRADDQLNERLRKGAEWEDDTVADFARKLTRWALNHYEIGGSFTALRSATVNFQEVPRSTKPVELTSHTSAQARHVTMKEEILNNQMSSAGAALEKSIPMEKAKPKTHRSKAS